MHSTLTLMGLLSPADQNSFFNIAWKVFPQDIFKGYIYECFAGYFSTPKSWVEKEFIFAYPALPTWFERVIKKLNRKFENINYEILDVKEVSLDLVSNVVEVSNPTQGEKRAFCPLFRLNLNKEYSDDSIYYLRYILHHILRMMSYTEGDFIQFEDVEHPKKYDSIQWLCDLNNRKPGYRSLAEGNVEKNMLLHLDNINIINECEFDSNMRQTAILTTILQKVGYNFENKFKVGDIIKPNEKSERYSVTNLSKMKEGRVLQTFSFDRIYIEVTKHSERLALGYRSTVSSYCFDLVEE